MTDTNQVSRRRSPTHPGDLVARFLLRNRDLTQEVMAKRLGVSRVTLNRLLNKRQSMSAEMALRIEKFTQIKAQIFLQAQIDYDLYQAEKDLSQELAKISVGEQFLEAPSIPE